MFPTNYRDAVWKLQACATVCLGSKSSDYFKYARACATCAVIIMSMHRDVKDSEILTIFCGVSPQSREWIFLRFSEPSALSFERRYSSLVKSCEDVSVESLNDQMEGLKVEMHHWSLCITQR